MGGGNKGFGRSREDKEQEDERVEKKARHGRSQTGLELRLEGGPLRELGPEKLKNEIRRWARAVARYARQLSRTLSGRLSFSRRSSSTRYKDDEDDAAPGFPSPQ